MAAVRPIPALTTIVLIAINALVWAAISATGGALSRLVDILALLPVGRCLSASDARSYYPDAGAQACRLMADGSWQPGVAEGAYWQLLTSAFTHIEIFHIGMNMLALWFLGPSLERALGRVRFLAVYLISALAGFGGRAVAVRSERLDARCVRRRLRPDRRAAGAGLQGARRRPQRDDLAGYKRGVHLHRPRQHLLAGPPRRPARRPGGSGHRGLRAAGRSSHVGSCSGCSA